MKMVNDNLNQKVEEIYTETLKFCLKKIRSELKEEDLICTVQKLLAQSDTFLINLMINIISLLNMEQQGKEKIFNFSINLLCDQLKKYDYKKIMEKSHTV